MTNRNTMVITKGGNIVVTFRSDIKLSAEQRAWLHNNGLRRDKWEANKYFISFREYPSWQRGLPKLLDNLYFRVLKLHRDDFKEAYDDWSAFCYEAADVIRRVYSNGYDMACDRYLVSTWLRTSHRWKSYK